MTNIIFREKVIFSLENTDLELFRKYCDLKGILYSETHINKELILLPPLKGKTFVLKGIAKTYAFESCFKGLQDFLTARGALVTYEGEDIMSGQTLEALNHQLFLYFNIKKGKNFIKEIVFYPWGNHNSSSFSLVSKIIKHILLETTQLVYSVASSWKKICAIRYWRKLFFSSTPSLIIEANDAVIFDEFGDRIKDWLGTSLVEIYGEKYSDDDVEKIFEIIDISKQDVVLSKNAYSDSTRLEVFEPHIEEEECFLPDSKESFNEGDFVGTQSEYREYEDVELEKADYDDVDDVNEREDIVEAEEIEGENENGFKNEFVFVYSDEDEKENEDVDIFDNSSQPQEVVNKEEIVFNEQKRGFSDSSAKTMKRIIQHNPLSPPTDGPIHQFARPNSISMPQNSVGHLGNYNHSPGNHYGYLNNSNVNGNGSMMTSRSTFRKDSKSEIEEYYSYKKNMINPPDLRRTRSNEDIPENQSIISNQEVLVSTQSSKFFEEAMKNFKDIGNVKLS